MPLKVELKPGERMMIGDCLLTNCESRTRFLVEGSAPILREKDIMTPERADTPAKRIYFAVQLMYAARDPKAHHEFYFKLTREIAAAAPSTWPHLENINNQILMGDFYKALKQARRLIAYEQELLADAARGESLRDRGETDCKPARTGSKPAAAGRLASSGRL